MRPSAFTDGNARHPGPTGRRRCGFNEAVGFHRRKRRPGAVRTPNQGLGCFNEAVGFHRRKLARTGGFRYNEKCASMRPSAFTDGNRCRCGALRAGHFVASMRPSAFTDGNDPRGRPHRGSDVAASMRPSAFTDGNMAFSRERQSVAGAGFNEAVGFHRRKRRDGMARYGEARDASMRPSAFTDGNTRRTRR